VLEQADLIFYNGYNLEPALIRLINGAGVEAEQVALAEQVEPLAFEYEGQTEPDPHVWGDVENAIVMVAAIAATLSEQFPEDAAVFDQNAADLIEELRALDGWIVAQMETIPPDQRTLVTTHDAFQYYANAYGLTVLGTLIGISTEEQPSAQTVQQLVEAIRQAQVPAIFAETTLNPALITTVAEEAGVQLADPALYSDSLGAAGSGAETYITMMVDQYGNRRSGLGGAGGTLLNPPNHILAPFRMGTAANLAGDLKVKAAVGTTGGIAQQHIGFSGGAVTLFDIAPHAGGDHVFPSVAAAPRSRHHVV
jgi:manganese/iron transport system substrate-binding protein